MKNVKETKDKRWMNVLKTKYREFSIIYSDVYRLYFRGDFYLHVKYDLCCSKCWPQSLPTVNLFLYSKVLRDDGKVVILIH